MRYQYINEAADSLKKMETIKKELRKKLNTCKLTSFKSATDCSDFYSVFFCNSMPKDMEITAKEWFNLYHELADEKNFLSNLIYYMSNWTPDNYTMLFRGLRSLIDEELLDMEKNRLVYLSDMISNMRQLNLQFSTILTLLSKELFQPDLIIFPKTAVTVLTQYQFELNAVMQKELHAADEKRDDGLARVVRNDDAISEDCKTLIDALETARTMLESTDTPLDEGIVSTTKDRANQALVQKRKVADYMDRTVFKLYDNWRKRKETKNHEEMMGETLKLSTAVKKIFRTFISYQIFGPVGAIITAIVTHAIDERTTKTDRLKIVYDVRDELEIIDEKISIAEKNGDEKAKIEMMRIRQKLRREYERLTRGITHKVN